LISKSKQIQIDKTRLIDTFVNGWDRIVTNPILSLIKNNQDVAEVKKEARNDKNKCLSWLMKQINNQPDEINIGRLQEQLEMIFTLTTCSNNPPEFLREEIDARGEQPIEEILQYWITRFTYCS
jgi:hypothetical protein